MNDTYSQQSEQAEISGTPTFFAENQLDPSLDQQFNKLNFDGRNSTISAVEKSFKDEEHIYVSIFSPSIWISKTIAVYIIDRIRGRRSTESN